MRNGRKKKLVVNCRKAQRTACCMGGRWSYWSVHTDTRAAAVTHPAQDPQTHPTAKERGQTLKRPPRTLTHKRTTSVSGHLAFVLLKAEEQRPPSEDTHADPAGLAPQETSTPEAGDTRGERTREGSSAVDQAATENRPRKEEKTPNCQDGPQPQHLV